MKINGGDGVRQAADLPYYTTLICKAFIGFRQLSCWTFRWTFSEGAVRRKPDLAEILMGAAEFAREQAYDAYTQSERERWLAIAREIEGELEALPAPLSIRREA